MVSEKEYIERGAVLKTPPFTKYGGDSSEYAEGYLDCIEEARNAVNDAPAADVISRGVFEQVKWERDMAMQQLEEHGIPFGGEADDVVNVVRCKDCIHSVQLLDRLMCKRTAHKSENGWFGLRATADKHFCSYGERKEQT